MGPLPELLAPVASIATFEAALEEGADAVYVGVPGCNARALSRDLSFGALQWMTRQAHSRNKRIYLAMNSLIREDEMPAIITTLSRLVSIGPDGLIIQDLGLLHLLRTFFPELIPHASTLMSIHNVQAASFFGDLGCQRVVLARELTHEEIDHICRNTGVAVEIFIHGAMCFSYSGLCLFSSLHGGRSSLRGQCVQPCRRHYRYQSRGRKSKGGYLFSMNDLSGIEHLGPLIRSGVVSLKIEGRLRSVEYVRQVVRGYRLALNSLQLPVQKQKKRLQHGAAILDRAMGRSRGPGYFDSKRPERAVIPSRSGNTGIMVGRIRAIVHQSRGSRTGRRFLVLRLRHALAVGERLRLHDERSGERFSFTLRSMEKQHQAIRQARAGQTVHLAVPPDIRFTGRGQIQATLFKVDVDNRSKKRKNRQPPSYKRVHADQVRVKTILNRLSPQHVYTKPGQQPAWWVQINSLGQVHHRFPVKAHRLLIDLNPRTFCEFRQLTQVGNKQLANLIWCLPPVIHDSQLHWFQRHIDQLVSRGYHRFQLGQLAQLLYFRHHPEATLYGGSTLNILNSCSLEMVADLGLAGSCFSLETDQATLEQALTHFRARSTAAHAPKLAIGMLVYGRPPLFTSRLDASHFHYHTPFTSPRGERFMLRREHELTRVYGEHPFSLLSFRSTLVRLGLDYLILDLSQGNLKKETTLCASLLRGEAPATKVLKGNFAATLT